MGARELLANAARDAVISPCGQFRYWLLRRWADGPLLLFVMLNPSTADDQLDDATIRRCATFAAAHGFGGFAVVNLFAYRATDPADLRRSGWKVGPENDEYITRAAFEAEAICVAWGANAAQLERPHVVLQLLRRAGKPLQCLAITRHGHPQHPLFIASDQRLRPFGQQATS